MLLEQCNLSTLPHICRISHTISGGAEWREGGLERVHSASMPPPLYSSLWDCKKKVHVRTRQIWEESMSVDSFPKLPPTVPEMPDFSYAAAQRKWEEEQGKEGEEGWASNGLDVTVCLHAHNLIATTTHFGIRVEHVATFTCACTRTCCMYLLYLILNTTIIHVNVHLHVCSETTITQKLQKNAHITVLEQFRGQLPAICEQTKSARQENTPAACCRTFSERKLEVLLQLDAQALKTKTLYM